jgi:hypothetical protein
MSKLTGNAKVIIDCLMELKKKLKIRNRRIIGIKSFCNKSNSIIYNIE